MDRNIGFIPHVAMLAAGQQINWRNIHIQPKAHTEFIRSLTFLLNKLEILRIDVSDVNDFSIQIENSSNSVLFGTKPTMKFVKKTLPSFIKSDHDFSQQVIMTKDVRKTSADCRPEYRKSSLQSVNWSQFNVTSDFVWEKLMFNQPIAVVQYGTILTLTKLIEVDFS